MRAKIIPNGLPNPVLVIQDIIITNNTNINDMAELQYDRADCCAELRISSSSFIPFVLT
ncbi:hypothetical protein ACE1CD_27885 [Aerosakkonema sp. BLCC-F183]|uniref:hypothetical protein n=1 Tax=Aerosakkonema sp. BLCC-F183 TaxID=3342834 RepID=UPI0035B90D15